MSPIDQQLLEWQELMKPTELHPVLAKRLFPHDRLGRILHHKLVISPMYNEQMNGMLNKQYEHKSKAYFKACRDRNYAARLAIVERPYRVAELVSIMRLHSLTAKEFGKFICETWIDTEDPYAQGVLWKKIFRRLKTMYASTANTYWLSDNEPDQWYYKNVITSVSPVKVYRGFTDEGVENGWSWTTDAVKALWFAKRYKGNGWVARAYMPTDKVLGHFTGRKEAEIVAFPGSARVADVIESRDFELMSKEQRRSF